MSPNVVLPFPSATTHSFLRASSELSNGPSDPNGMALTSVSFLTFSSGYRWLHHANARETKLSVRDGILIEPMWAPC